MTDLRTAAQQALEALEYGQDTLKQTGENQWESRGQLAMDALRAALVEPEPEPVAWALHTGTRQGIKWNRRVEHGTPIYTAFRAALAEQLTDEQISDLWHQSGEQPFKFARMLLK